MPAAIQSDADLEELLAEARVSLEFGDLDAAEQQARRVLASAPHSDGGRAVMSSVHEARGQDEEALRVQRERLALAAAGGDGELLTTIESEVARLRDKLEQGAASADSSAAAPAEADWLPDIEIVLVDEDDSDSEYASVEPPLELMQRRASTAATPEPPELEAAVAPTAPVAQTAQTAIEPPPDLHDLIEAPEPSAPPELHDPPAILPADDLIEELEADFTLSGADEPLPVVQAEGESGSWGNSSLRIQVSLDDAEELYLRGRYAEAEARYRAVLESAPNHPRALLRLGEIENERTPDPGAVSVRDAATLPEPPPAAPAAAPAVAPAPRGPEPTTFVPESEADFDLAAELADELGVETDAAIPTDPDGFQSVLQSFKRGIHEQIGPDECDARYDLAIAYKEMGLVEDAVENLELAIAGGVRKVEGLALLGECKVELGRPAEAVTHLLTALGMAAADPETTVSLQYELGTALRAAGRGREALDAFRKVAASDPGFREVRQQISELEQTGA
jgi:tetratricopeptide (TPR) repeat protein